MTDRRLSENFWLSEFLRSQTAARHGIDMTPTDRIIDNLYELCHRVLEPVRLTLGGRAVIITSGYRPEKLNKLIGGSKTSAHMDGRAADIIVQGVSPYAVCLAIRDYVSQYDQNIHEFGQWTHVGIAYQGAIPRAEDLTAVRLPSGTSYRKGIYRVEELLNV